MLRVDDVSGRNQERERRFAIIQMDYECLAKLMDLPAGCSIIGIKDVYDNNSITIKVLHTGVKSTPAGVELPTLSQGQANWGRIM